MNLKGGDNTILIPGRQKQGQYSLRFTRVDNKEVANVDVSNIGSTLGPLLFTFHVGDDIQLQGGDHLMQLFLGGEVWWDEQVRVSDLLEVVAPDPSTASMRVSGAGDPDADGDYEPVGENDGHNMYAKPGWTAIYVASGAPYPWNIYNDDFSSAYVGGDGQYPWDAEWLANPFPGPPPGPIVTMV